MELYESMIILSDKIILYEYKTISLRPSTELDKQAEVFKRN